MSEDAATPSLEELESRFSGARDAIFGPFLSSVRNRSSPSLIYHYTDDRGLYSILTGGKLWFSDIFDLNDPSELYHGVDVAVNAARRLARRKNATNIFQYFAKKLRSGLRESVESTACYFVCCFSEDGDDLGQWRAYAADGQGYALGFDRQELEDAFLALYHEGVKEGVYNPFIGTFSVNYNKGDAQKIHEELIECAKPFLEPLDQETYDPESVRQFLIRLSVNLSTDLLLTSLFFKDGTFRNEQEYRFLQVLESAAGAEDIKYRPRSHSLVKYREFDWRNLAPNALRKIVIGPAADLKASGEFVIDCLDASDYLPDHIVNISKSDIPYQSFK